MDIKEVCIYLFYDVLAKSIFATLKQYLSEEWHDKRKENPPCFADWNEVLPCVPKQNNSYDCGMFLLHFALAIAINYSALLKGTRQIGNIFKTISQSDMPRLRGLAEQQICKGSLLFFE